MLLDGVKAFLRLSKIRAAFDHQALLEPEKFNVALLLLFYVLTMFPSAYTCESTNECGKDTQGLD